MKVFVFGSGMPLGLYVGPLLPLANPLILEPRLLLW